MSIRTGRGGFYSDTANNFFKGVNKLFNSQPDGIDYILAGWKIRQYGISVRKGMGIDFRYLDCDQLWNIDINEEDERKISR